MDPTQYGKWGRPSVVANVFMSQHQLLHKMLHEIILWEASQREHSAANISKKLSEVQMTFGALP